MYTCKGQIKGTSPILFNRPADDCLDPGPKPKTEEEILEAARNKVHSNGNGLFFPRGGFKWSILNGSRIGGFKEGKKAFWFLLKPTMYVMSDLEFGKKTFDYMDKKFVTNEKTKSLVKSYRPALKAGWEADFELIVLDDRRNPDFIKAAIDEAGLLIGIGSGRPEFGRFELTGWKVTKQKR